MHYFKLSTMHSLLCFVKPVVYWDELSQLEAHYDLARIDSPLSFLFRPEF
jgi:hypothetical protein